jgi:DNA-binding NarL/FixJ family response regulator
MRRIPLGRQSRKFTLQPANDGVKEILAKTSKVDVPRRIQQRPAFVESEVHQETWFILNQRLYCLTEGLNLLIADDHPLYRGALREAVTGLFERIDIAEAGTFNEVTELLERGSEVDLVLLDLTMPGVRSFSGLMYLRAQYPSVPVIVVSANDDPAAIRRCMEFGASGFIPKTLGVEVMRDAISCILSGGVWTPPDVDLSAGSDAETAALMTRMTTLTPQQVRVLMMLSEGLLNKQIAYQLGVSEATVKAHVSAILQKLGVESRTQAVIAAAKIETGQWSQGAPAAG